MPKFYYARQLYLYHLFVRFAPLLKRPLMWPNTVAQNNLGKLPLFSVKSCTLKNEKKMVLAFVLSRNQQLLINKMVLVIEPVEVN